MATPVVAALRRAVADLDALKIRWALVGGLAVSVRAVPRFTKDLDFAVAVAGDPEAEDVVHRLGGRGYRPVGLLEQEYVERMSGVRLERGGSDVVMTSCLPVPGSRVKSSQPQPGSKCFRN
jgi:Nucleotidyl transferase AbiEii toxin, Type IV TA system